MLIWNWWRKSMIRIEPGNVIETLSKNLLVDGYDIIVDLEKSHDSYLWDAKNEREYLDSS